MAEINEEPNPEQDEQEPDPDEWWSWGNFARLFIFPLVIVVVAVGIYGFFQYLVQDNREVKDYVAELQTGPDNHRWRAAYDLAQYVRHRGGKDFTESSASKVIEIFETTDDSEMKTYLALVLAEIPIDKSRQALESGLEAEASSVREASALGLGRMEATDSVDDIIQTLDDDSYEVRRMAAFALGGLGDTAAIDPLRSQLDDSSIDVRLNSAVALSRLGSDAGKRVLLDYLEQATQGEFEDLNVDQRRNILTTAMEALKRTETKEALPLLKELQDQDPDSSVRMTAMEVREALEASGG